METALQQRIVGAVVLVALGVIFIPALLDGAGYKSRHGHSIEVPARPPLPSLKEQWVKPVSTPLDAEIEKLEKQPLRKPATPAVKQAGKSDNDDRAGLKSWMLQVGTFTNRDNAEKHRDELRKKGYSVQVMTDTLKGKTSYKVRIGPDLSRERIEKLRDKLKKQGIDGYIVPHG